MRQTFRDLWRNDDRAKYGLGREVLAGEHEWLEDHPLHEVSDRKSAAAHRVPARSA